MEDMRCIAAMRKEPLEVYKWGRIPPKPDTRTLTEKIEGMDYGIRNRMCCSVDACSITDYQDCARQRAADLEELLAGRRLESVEEAFAALAKGKVDVPMPMHIGIDESAVAGPGDCHIKGGYVSATPTFTVKLACVSFYKNLEAGLPPGSGIFIVVNAVSKFTCFCQ